MVKFWAIKTTLLTDIVISQVPIFIPIFVVVTSACLVSIPLIYSKNMEFIYALSFMLCGIPVYYIFVYKKKTIPMMKKVTHFLQKLMNVAPTDTELLTW